MPSLAALDPLVAALAVVGAVWGFVSDRIAARWPAHEDGSVRRIDWRTVVVILVGAVALAAVPARYGATGDRVLFGAYFLAMILLMATDLDQRLMPDVVTLPIIAAALVVAVAGLSPIVAGKLPAAIAGAVIVPGALYILSIPFGEGAFGLGDVKFLAGLGLVVGLARTVAAVFVGALIAGVVIVALLAARRITLKSYVPFGPFLIAGAFWAILMSAA